MLDFPKTLCGPNAQIYCHFQYSTPCPEHRPRRMLPPRMSKPAMQQNMMLRSMPLDQPSHMSSRNYVLKHCFTIMLDMSRRRTRCMPKISSSFVSGAYDVFRNSQSNPAQKSSDIYYSQKSSPGRDVRKCRVSLVILSIENFLCDQLNDKK